AVVGVGPVRVVSCHLVEVLAELDEIPDRPSGFDPALCGQHGGAFLSVGLVRGASMDAARGAVGVDRDGVDRGDGPGVSGCGEDVLVPYPMRHVGLRAAMHSRDRSGMLVWHEWSPPRRQCDPGPMTPVTCTMMKAITVMVTRTAITMRVLRDGVGSSGMCAP